MFSADSVIGEIEDPQGCLKVGNVGDTECVYLSYKSKDGERQFHVVYTGRENSTLLAAIKKGAELAPNTKPRSTVRLSALPPKPTRLQLVLVAPENKSPLVILRFLEAGWKQDFFAQPEVLVDLFQKAQRRAPMPGVVGILDRFGTNIWMIEGQTLEAHDDWSHGIGFFGEYVHHSEVPEGQVVRAWPVVIEQKMVIAAFEYAQAWEPSASPDLPQGQQGDRALAEGLVRQSREAHALLSKTMYDSGKVDPIWAGKVALSSIIGDIVMSDDKVGLATWSGQGGNPVIQQGMASLKAGMLSPHDNAVFSILSAYFQSRLPDAEAAIAKVNQEMSAAWTYALFNAPEMKHLVLNDWYLLLKQRGLSESSPAFAAWNEAKSHYPEALRPTVFCLPPPFPWVKSWKPALTEAPQEEAPTPTPAKHLEQGPPQLPPVPSTPGVSSALPPAEEAQEEEEELLENEGPFRGMKEPKKKKSAIPLLVAGLFLVVLPAAYFFLAGNSDPDPKASPSPTMIATETPQSTATPQATATPQEMAATQTPAPVTSAPLPEGDLSINGFPLSQAPLRDSDLAKAGYQQIEFYAESDSAIARYRSSDGEIIVNLKMPSRQVTAIQGNSLHLEGQKVADLSSQPESWRDDKRFSKYKLQAVVDNEGKVRAYTFAVESIYLPEPLLDSPNGAIELYRKIRDDKFFESLPSEVANMHLTDGNPLIFQYLDSFKSDRLKYLLAQGADPNQKSWNDGSTALHNCNNVKTAKLLLELGADPTLTNDQGQTPFDTAQTEELRAVLKPKPSATATPSPTPDSATPTPTPVTAIPAPATSSTPLTTASPTSEPEPNVSPVAE